MGEWDGDGVLASSCSDHWTDLMESLYNANFRTYILLTVLIRNDYSLFPQI